MKELLKAGPQYKFNLHCHTTLSDGRFSPEKIKAIYRSMGYDGVAFTDHRVVVPHGDLTDETFLALVGTELDFHETVDEGKQLVKAVHINAISPDPEKNASFSSMPLDYALVRQTIADLKKEGYFVTLNHPVWSNMIHEDLVQMGPMDAIEIYNSIAAYFNNYADDSVLYESFLRRGGRALPVAGDDTHLNFEDGSPFVEYGRACTMICADSLSYDAVFAALSQGSLYATTSPRFHRIALDGDTLTVTCSPVLGVYVHSEKMNRKTQAISRSGELTEVTLDISSLREASPYFWIQLRDKTGGKAWSVPYYFDEIEKERT